MNYKSIIITPAKAIKDVTVYATDYTEAGVEKTADGVKYLGRGARVLGVKTKVSFKAHRNASSDRRLTRALAREQKAHEKAMAKENEVVVENNDDLNEVKTQVKKDAEVATA